MEVLSDMFAKSVVPIPFLGKIISILIQESAYRISKIECFKKISSLTSKRYTLGYFLVIKKSI